MEEVKRGPGRPPKVKEPTDSEKMWSEIERRAKSVAEAIAAGLTGEGYLDDMSEANAWDLDKDQKATFLAQAKREQAEIADQEAERLDMVRKLDAMIRINFEEGDLKEARLCLKEKAAVLGIVVSRGTETKKPGAQVVESRFPKKWDEVAGVK